MEDPTVSVDRLLFMLISVTTVGKGLLQVPSERKGC